ncbi:hypothetical protein COTS27_01062 [Spirochaetota bacterium]|nr:hypothetical protein COTS27_01062 [Spirochaetota bacterium]
MNEPSSEHPSIKNAPPSKPYEIKLPAWSGPIELLVDLIRSSEVDIYSISISQITEDYLAALEEMRHGDIEISSDFLVMATTLVLYKTKSLLGESDYDDQDAESYKEALIEQVLAYEKYKKAAETLETLLKTAPHFTIEKIPFNERTPSTPTSQHSIQWNPVPLSTLVAAFYRIVDKKEQVLAEDSFAHFYEKIEQKITLITQLLEQPQAMTTGIPLSHVAQQTLATTTDSAPTDQATNQAAQPLFYKSDLIASFIAILELYKLAKLEARQKTMFAEIYLFNNNLRSKQTTPTPQNTEH